MVQDGLAEERLSRDSVWVWGLARVGNGLSGGGSGCVKDISHLDSDHLKVWAWFRESSVARASTLGAPSCWLPFGASASRSPSFETVRFFRGSVFGSV